MPKAIRRALGQTRQEELLHYLRAYKTVHVAELSSLLGASQSTIRRDLDTLQGRGLVERVHGGAALTAVGDEEVPPVRATTRADEKQRIGRAAAALVTNGSTILVTGGTTTAAMVPHLAHVEHVTVVTNALHIASLVAEQTHHQVIVLGGVLRREEMSLLGHTTTEALADFPVDTVFMGAFGIEPRQGLSGSNLVETHTDRALLTSGDRLVVLADASKFAQRGPVLLAPVGTIDVLVTDRSADPAMLAALREQAVEVVVC